MAIKITELDSGNNPVDGDLLETSQNVSVTPVSKKISFAQIRQYLDEYYLALSGGLLSGNLNMDSNAILNVADPVNAHDAANKAYVDSHASSASYLIPGVFGASTLPLTGWTYDNGTSGVGATLTAPSPGVFAADGFNVPVGQRWLYKNDIAGGGAYNGVYIVTVSSIGANAVLTRADDYNLPANMLRGRVINIQNGVENGGAEYMQTSVVTTVGSSQVDYYLLFNYSLVAKLSSNVTHRLAVFTSPGTIGTTGGNTLVSLLSPIEYEAGQSTSISTTTAGSISQSGTTVTGSGTNFNANMVGGILLPATGNNVLITGYSSTTGLTTAVGQTLSPGTPYRINYGGNSVDYFGNTGVHNIWVKNQYFIPTSTPLSGAFTYNGTNLLFGTDANVVQVGSVTPGNLAVWDATGRIEDGGPVPGGGGGGTLLNVQTLTGSGTFTPTAGATKMVIKAQAPGGGSGACNTTGASCSAGGFSGAYAEWYGDSTGFSYNCGTPGVAGTPNNNDILCLGGNASNLSITGLSTGPITCTGGYGSETTSIVNIPARSSTTLPTATGGTINISGQQGEMGFYFSATLLIPGRGADSPLGRGGAGTTVVAANLGYVGTAGTGYGSGAGGSAYSPTVGSTPTGQAGQPGVIYVFEYA